MSNEQILTIHIIDDDREIRKALQWLFESVELKVKTYENAKKFLEKYNASLRGCIILDVRMPYMTGLELLDRLNALNNRVPIIIITGHGDIPMAVRAMKSGAIEFIVKPINHQALLEIVYQYLSQPTNILEKKSPQVALLTSREQEVMDLIAEGKYNKEIASDLKISISTVEAHRSRIMEKFQVKNLAQLIKKYYQII